MKKYSIYILLLIAGIIIGKFALSGDQTQEHSHTEKTTESTTWTCSMHPQIQQPEPGDCPICGMDLIPAQEASSELSSDQFRMTENAMALANIQTSVVAAGTEGNAALQLTGTIEANEKTNAIQTAHFGGRIEKLYVNITGETVRKGQRIALIYSPELVTTQQELITAMRMKASQPELYNAVRNKLKLWKLSEAQIQQIETSKQVISQFPIYANVSGVVTEKLVEEGNHVMEGGALFKVSNLSSVWASFDAYETQLASIKLGDPIEVTTNANPTEKISAKITFIDPVLNTATRTVAVKAALNNRKEQLKPGMFVIGTLANASKAKSSTLYIPKSAIMWTGKRSVVYLKTSKTAPVFEAREVTLGTATKTHYEVLSGLLADDEIVTNGTFTVDAAAQLQGKKSMMNLNKAHYTDTQANVTKHMDFDAEFEKAFQPTITAYLALKDALVQSDSIQASTKSEAFRKAMERLTQEQRATLNMYWSVPHKTSKSINANVSLSKQRTAFQIVSNHIIAIVENFKTYDQKLAVQFCPMADNDKGAYWLSNETQIRNPYFGDAMLTCGNVTKVLE